MSVFYTLFYFLSTFFIVQLAPTFYGLPIIEQTKITVQVGLIAVILAAILSLCATQCIGINQVGRGIDDILILFVSQALMAIICGRINDQKLFVLFTAITALYLPRTPPLSAPTRKRKRRPKRDKKSEAVEDPGEALAMATPSLIVSKTILGRGSNNAVVYEGLFQGRAVAVKRYEQDLISLGTREVSILQQSNHPNVVRYICYQESLADSKFFYIVLDLCPGSLADVIENQEGDVGDKRRKEWKVIARGLDERSAMKQIASGLRHLHGLKLVHRDIKPQNILISPSSSSMGRYRMLISDFGLCKKLGVDQSRFLPTTYGTIAAGTAGWRAPEMIQCWIDGLESLDTLSTNNDAMASLATTIDGSSSGTSTTCQCLTESVDIFALGCLYFYILTRGGHPYGVGNRFDREANIINGIKDLSLISTNEEAHDLITHMLHRQPSDRPDIETCLLHPFFWNPAKRLAFLGDVSDRFEIMVKDPMDMVLIRLERDAKSIIKTDWHQTLDESPGRILIKNLRQSRKYDGNSVRDLLRALRNKKYHYQDLPNDVKSLLGPMPKGFLEYFTSRFPKLLVYLHEVVKETGLYRESIFTTYYELPET